MIAAALLAAAGAAAGSCPPAPPSGFVALKTSFGGVIAPTEALAQEVAAGGRRAEQAARQNLGIDPAPFLIAPTTTSDALKTSSCTFTFNWSPVPNATGLSSLPSHVLPHELGHEMFVRYLVARTRIEEYGGDAPDWLDEMAAVAFEDDAGTKLRREDAARHAARNELIPLGKLLVMPHPEWAARSRTPIAGRSSSGPASVDTPAYYATVRAMFDYLVHRTGDPRIIRVLAEKARSHEPIERWLVEKVGDGSPDPTLRSIDEAIRSNALAAVALNGTADELDPLRKP